MARVHEYARLGECMSLSLSPILEVYPVSAEPCESGYWAKDFKRKAGQDIL